MKKNVLLIAAYSVILFITGCNKSGTINGEVTSSSLGSPIAGAMVKTDPATSVVMTNSEGRYTIPNISPGKYTVTATFSKNGIAGSANVTIQVVANKTTIADMALLWRHDSPQEKLIGSWRLSCDGLLLELIFYNNSTWEERDTKDHHRFTSGNYHVDFSKNPAWIDIAPTEKLSLGKYGCTPLTKGIIRFVNDDVIEIRFRRDSSGRIGGERPTLFDVPSEDSILTDVILVLARGK
jgi:hypothetical protein